MFFLSAVKEYSFFVLSYFALFSSEFNSLRYGDCGVPSMISTRFVFFSPEGITAEFISLPSILIELINSPRPFTVVKALLPFIVKLKETVLRLSGSQGSKVRFQLFSLIAKRL